METRTYILVHGAWHGGWVWRRVAERLRELGHLVFAPTITGSGERAHLMNRETDLKLNVEDILAVIRCEDLSDVILCGHSYAGMIITAVADRIPGLVRTLVYVDAYVPADGDSVLDLRPAKDTEVLMEQVRLKGDGWRMPPRSAEDLGVRSPADRAWVESHLTETALSCFHQPVSLSRSVEDGEARLIYVRAADYPNDRFWSHFEYAAASSRWDAYAVEGAGHDIMVDQPDKLVEILAAVG